MRTLFLFTTLIVLMSTYLQAQATRKTSTAPVRRTEPTAEQVAALESAKPDAAQAAADRTVPTYKPLRSSGKNVSRPGIMLGFRGSLLFNKMEVSNENGELGEPSGYRTPGGALLISVPLGNNPLSLQLEPGYSERGGLFTTKGLMNNGVDRYEDKTTIKFQSLEMPLLFRFMPSVGPLDVVLAAGVEGRYLLNGKSVFKAAEYDIGTGALVDSFGWVSAIEPDEMNRLDIGLIGGLGLSLPLSFGQIFLDGRYQHGVRNLMKDENIMIYQRGISANVGVLFPLGR